MARPFFALSHYVQVIVLTTTASDNSELFDPTYPGALNRQSRSLHAAQPSVIQRSMPSPKAFQTNQRRYMANHISYFRALLHREGRDSAARAC
jgi:hypothetical protein